MDIGKDFFVCVRCMTYNQSVYITDALNGFVMQQTDFSFIAIIVDDASTDGEQDVIRKYVDKHFGHSIESGFKEWETEDAFWTFARHNENKNCHFVLVYLKKNLFGKAKKNEIIKDWCNTKYIALCEGDDYWTDPLKLQKQVDFLEGHEDVGMCYSDYSRFYEATKVMTYSMFEKQGQYRPTTYEQHLLKPGYLAPMTWVYRKELLGYIDNKGSFTDGSYMYMLEWLYNSKVEYLPFNTAVYRSHKGSASAPRLISGLYRYVKGIFDIQRYYSEKYPCTLEFKEKLMFRGYLDVLPVAVNAHEEGFIKEASTYFSEHSCNIDIIIRDLNAGQSIRESYAYRIGKRIVKPLSWMRRKWNRL